MRPPVPKRILNTGAKLTHQHVSKPYLPTPQAREQQEIAGPPCLLGKNNTAALLKLVRIHSNDTISHPLVKQSTCSQGVWNNYFKVHASTQPCCLLLPSKGSLQYKPLCPGKFRVGTAGTLTTHQNHLLMVSTVPASLLARKGAQESEQGVLIRSRALGAGPKGPRAQSWECAASK